MVRHPACDRLPHGLREVAVLEVRLAEEAEVVDDHVRAGGREARGPRPRRRSGLSMPLANSSVGAGREVVHDLEHRGAFRSAAGRHPGGTAGPVAGSSPLGGRGARPSMPSEMTPTRTPAPVDSELRARQVGARRRCRPRCDARCAPRSAGRTERTPSSAASTPSRRREPSPRPARSRRSRARSGGRRPSRAARARRRGPSSAHLDPDPVAAPPARRRPAPVGARQRRREPAQARAGGCRASGRPDRAPPSRSVARPRRRSCRPSSSHVAAERRRAGRAGARTRARTVSGRAGAHRDATVPYPKSRR